ncbi:hypothetical protein AJ80_02680 [Polytolypa hystricis UAMH7299]|uniref:SET domain-containing protein n=1 Tax=Polytolypa hystricis (strain UAMH7299) TaxID=1447883 RepID=A0A2B7YGQ5_POLH7|nr:hypothetical protein AJ80_02680 [Polytolypa hystricis UAMH7299]
MDLLKNQEESTALLHADPHNPMRHLHRGLIHSKLGFPDLAAADAYRSLTLFEFVVDPDSCEYMARKRIDMTRSLDAAADPVSSFRRLSLNGSESEESAERDGDSGDVDGDGDVDDDDGFEPVSYDEYLENIRDVFRLLVRSLVQCGCMRDAYEFCVQGLKTPDREGRISGDAMLEEQLTMIKRSYKDKSKRAKDGHDEAPFADLDASRLDAQGSVWRVVYPWNTHEPDRNSPEVLQFLNERLKQVAPKCEVRSVALPTLYDSLGGDDGKNQDGDKEVSVQLGLVAIEDIAPGEVLLHESTLLTATNRLHDDLCDACNGPLQGLSSPEPSVACENCADTIFCSEKCHDLAQGVYHAAECGQEGLESIGKDIPDPKDKADYLYLLLLGRSIAMAATQDVHPLDLPEVKYIWGDFRPVEEVLPSLNPSQNRHEQQESSPPATSGSLPFSFHLSILQPMRILEEMGIDPFSSLDRYDTWIFNTLYAKFRGTASGRLSTWDGGPEVCAVHPLWCLANHSCDPNVRWEWGGEITFTARTEEELVKWHSGGGGRGGGGEAGAVDNNSKGRKASGNVGIRKGEEILNHYCDLDLVVKERREWAMGALGGACLCERCVWEAGLGS